MRLGEFIEEIYRFGLEKFRRYYGPYRAIVVSNQDPTAKGKIQVQCPRARLSKDNNIWVSPMEAGAGKNKGVFWPPDVGDGVWLFFDNGDPTRPLCYMGGWYAVNELHADLTPDQNGNPHRRGFISPGGHKIILDDTSGSEQISVEHKNGQRLLVDNDGIKIGSKNGLYEPILKGETVQEWLNSHTHGTGTGPSTTPIIPLPDSALSTDTKTS